MHLTFFVKSLTLLDHLSKNLTNYPSPQDLYKYVPLYGLQYWKCHSLVGNNITYALVMLCTYTVWYINYVIIYMAGFVKDCTINNKQTTVYFHAITSYCQYELICAYLVTHMQKCHSMLFHICCIFKLACPWHLDMSYMYFLVCLIFIICMATWDRHWTILLIHARMLHHKSKPLHTAVWQVYLIFSFPWR